MFTIFLPIYSLNLLMTLFILAPGLSKNGFIRAQQFVFQHTGADEEKLRNEFRILGYNSRYIPSIPFLLFFLFFFTFKYTIAPSIFIILHTCIHSLTVIIVHIDHSMKFESGRSAVLSVHGTTDFTIKTTVFDAAAYEEAVELPAKMAGECTTFEDGA